MDAKHIQKQSCENHDRSLGEDSISSEDILRSISSNDSGKCSILSSDLSGNMSQNSFLDLVSSDNVFEVYEFLESAYDPLSKVPHIHDLMLQHLSGQELLSACEVSLNWSQKLSKSRKFMSKIKLEVDLTDLIEGEDNMLAVVRSCRDYQNLLISLKNDKEVEKIVDWILKKFATSLVNLKIVKIGGFKSMMNRPMPYLNLESFEVHAICGRISCNLEMATKLKKLVVNGMTPDVLVSCLQRNPCLKELTLYENSFITYFDDDISLNTSFNLKKLAILDHLQTEKVLNGEFPAGDWDGQQRSNFIKLLKSQASRLKSLSLDSCRAEDLNRIIACLPNLKHLELNNVTGELESLMDLENNTSVKTFIAKKVSDELIDVITSNFLNLRVVYIESIKTNQFFTIVKNARRLKRFRYFWASASEKKGNSFVDLKRYYKQAEMCKSLKICIRVVKKIDFLKNIHK